MLTVPMNERLRTYICSRFLPTQIFSDLCQLVRAVVDSSVLKRDRRRIGDFFVCLFVCVCVCALACATAQGGVKRSH
jgi:hypothetical protein